MPSQLISFGFAKLTVMLLMNLKIQIRSFNAFWEKEKKGSFLGSSQCFKTKQMSAKAQYLYISYINIF